MQLNVEDPDATATYLMKMFPHTMRTVLAGLPAVRSEDVHIRLNRVDAPAPNGWNSALWHIGWHSPDVGSEYERLKALGTQFFRSPPPTAHFVAPDGFGIEISRGERCRFDHVHLMSDAPLDAGDWYVEVIGLRRGAEVGRTLDGLPAVFSKREPPGNQIHRPSVRVMADDILLFIYPNQHLEPRSTTAADVPTRMESSSGHVIDHLGLLVPDLDAVEQRLRAASTKIFVGRHPFGSDGLQRLIIEGPDMAQLAIIG